MKTKHLLAKAKTDGIEKLVVGAIVVCSNRVLLLTRADGEFMGGLVELPSGGVEAGESLKQALLRELEEETALSDGVVVTAYVDHFDYVSASGKRVRQFNFLVESASDDVSLNNKEHADYQWLDISLVPFEEVNISKATRKSITAALKLDEDGGDHMRRHRSGPNLLDHLEESIAENEELGRRLAE